MNLLSINVLIDGRHRFWKRGPLASIIESKDGAEKVLDYIYLNPLQEHWSLVNNPVDINIPVLDIMKQE